MPFARPRLLALACLLALTAACTETFQVVAGPTVDERGGVGGMVKVRVSAGVQGFGLAASAEAAGTQSAPNGVFGVGVGPMLHLAYPKLMGAAGGRVLFGLSPRGSFVGLAGGQLSLSRELRHRDEEGGRRCISWWLGGELSADYVFGAAPTSLLLSPGVVLSYRRYTSD
jgi:hypothetical protein